MGWSHLYTDCGEAANTLLSLYQIREYDLPRLAERRDNQYGKGVRSDGKNEARVLESRGLVESPPWGDPVPDVLSALLEPAQPATSAAQTVERKFSAALRGELRPLTVVAQCGKPIEVLSEDPKPDEVNGVVSASENLPERS